MNSQAKSPKLNCDFQVNIDSEFGNKLLQSLDFPLHLDFSQDHDKANESDAHLFAKSKLATGQWAPSNFVTDDEFESEEGLEAVIGDFLPSQILADYARFHSDFEIEINDSTTDLEAEELSLSATQTANQNSRQKVEIVVLSVGLTTPPSIIVGHPIRVSDIAMELHLRVTVCFQALGKWRCLKSFNRQIMLQGQEALLHLSSLGADIFVTPEVQQTDVLVSLKMLKWRYTLRFNITKMLNRKLQQLGPSRILSLSEIQNKALFADKFPQFEVLGFSENEQGLAIKFNAGLS